MKYHLITFGCQMNESDSERIVQVLEGLDYQKTSKMERADLIMVNMCSIRQSAVDRVFGLLPKFRKLQTTNYKLRTILTGCVLKKDRQKLAQGFDSILDIKNLPKLPQILSPQSAVEPRPWQQFYSGYSEQDYLKIVPKNQTNFRAFIPIITGCNNFCSFCVVPYTRGEEISRPADEILREVKTTIERGAKEIWLLGQNVNSYRSRLTQISTQKNAEINFPKLLRMVNDIPGDFWIRFTSSHPRDFSDELIETMAECEKVTPYLNLPVQSGDNEILKRMNRPYTVEQYKILVKKIRDSFNVVRDGLEKEIALSTDIIVGFPGETKEQFENTKKLFKEIKFDMAYIAKYSPRPGTAAAQMKDSVPRKEKEKREKVLTEILKKTALEKNKKYIGKIIEVLPEKNKGEFLVGKTRTYKTVKFKGPKEPFGQFAKVKISAAVPWGLKGTLLTS